MQQLLQEYEANKPDPRVFAKEKQVGLSTLYKLHASRNSLEPFAAESRPSGRGRVTQLEATWINHKAGDSTARPVDESPSSAASSSPLGWKPRLVAETDVSGSADLDEAATEGA